jgi:hypothetical protein
MLPESSRLPNSLNQSRPGVTPPARSVSGTSPGRRPAREPEGFGHRQQFPFYSTWMPTIGAQPRSSASVAALATPGLGGLGAVTPSGAEVARAQGVLGHPKAGGTAERRVSHVNSSKYNDRFLR